MWNKGKPENEGIYYLCYLDPFGSGTKVYGEGAVHADGTVYALGEVIQTVYGWFAVPDCPFK